MELEISPIQPEGIINKILPKKPEQIDLILNIHFGEHKEEIHYGSGNVSFGLKRGELRIKLTNGEVPLKNFKLKEDFQTVVETEVQKERGSEKQSGVQVVLKNPGITAGSKAAQKKSEKAKIIEYQVKTIGSQLNQPSWAFEVKTGKDILEGLLQNTELATINIKSKPCHLMATFEVSKPEDICITNGELLWSRNITKNKIAVIERKIARILLDEVLNQKSFLSRVELIHE
ncbi:MAG: hypothetical protein AAFV28_01135 [Cyanobacteria bacterium J06635_13]